MMIKMLTKEEFDNLSNDDKYLLYSGTFKDVKEKMNEAQKEMIDNMKDKSPAYAFATGFNIGVLGKYLGGYTINV